MKSRLLHRWAWRELFHGQLWPVLAALSLIVASVFALAALAGRIESVATQEGRAMLAADLVLRVDAPLTPEQFKNVTQEVNAVSEQTRFSTMAFSQEEMQLVDVKVVDSSYPLRGELVLAGQQGNQAHVNPGEFWLAERLFSLLDVKIGDQVELGDAQLKVTGILQSEPELSFNPFNQKPSVMIHRSDLDAVGAVQIGGRASYRYFFLGSDEALNALQKQYPAKEGWRWIDDSDEGRTGEILSQTRDYLSLTIVLVIIMAAATLQLTCRHYVTSRMRTLGMLKSLGASRGWVRNWLGIQICFLFSLGISLGLGIGILLEYLLRLPLVDVLPTPVPSFGVTPWIVAPCVAVLVALPAMGIPLYRMVNASSLTIFQSVTKDTPVFNRVNVSLIAIPIVALLIWSYDNQLLWIVLFVLVTMLVCLAFFGLKAVAFLKTRRSSPSIKLALSRITRNKWMSGAQLGALATSFMLLAIIWLMRSDILSDWQQTLPVDAPNVFAVNISDQELTSYLDHVDKKQLVRSDAYPIIRGRLIEKNGVPFSELEPDRRIRANALKRELNFTWRETVPEQNKIVSGKWGDEGVSVEESIAKRLGIRLGDELTFLINSETFSAKVTSIREVEWRNMRPNFYFIFEQVPPTNFSMHWVVSYRLDENDNVFINQLAREYPTISLLDLRRVGDKIQSVLQQISLSLSILAGLAVVSGLLLILTLLRLSLADRQNEIKLYRTLGASKRQIKTTLWAEYGILAVLSGGIAVIGAELAMVGLLKWGMELPVTLHPVLWISLPLIALLLVFFTVSWMLKGLLIPLKSSVE